ncbi:MAG TPA: putative nucleotidyltransferase substrate binding domain-containing protein [Solirubrobacteraceae bacterium]|nr:putative nucleotidyltransferase substrate binding domain-containing protein [Solirubrobacteraceae bacterium]
MQDVADFLAAHPPFDALEPDEVESVARTAEVEYHAAGTEIFHQGAEPVDHVWVVRSGAVEIVHDRRVLDLLGPGELFGHGSMLSGLPTGFAAVAAEDSLCYRIRADIARPLLARPAGLRYVTRSLLEAYTSDEHGEPPVNPAQRPVSDLMRAPVVLCSPDTSIREAARMMAAESATAVVVDLGDDGLGIMTDRDLRSRVVAAGVDPEAPVSLVMSAPAYTVASDRRGSEVLLDMLDRCIRHFPVLSPTGRVVGVVEDSDLVAVATRSSFHLRAAIARAGTPAEVAEASAGLCPAVVALHDARVAAIDISAIYSVVADAVVRRLLDLTVDAPPAPFAWIALGSIARREAVPSSDVDSALVWYTDDEAPRGELMALAAQVMDGLVACGFKADPKGAVASKPLFARSHAQWQSVVASWIDNPTQEKALILVSLVVDGRPVWGISSGPPVPDAFREARRRPELLRLLAQFALSHRPPTGFLRGLVVEDSGEHRGRLDLKRGGIVPIADLARWAGLAAGVTHASTPARLRAAAEAGTLEADDARMLEEARELIAGLRLAHQVEQLKAGIEPDDFLDPDALSPLTRSTLKEAFRAVAGVQRRIGADLRLGVR